MNFKNQVTTFIKIVYLKKYTIIMKYIYLTISCLIMWTNGFGQNPGILWWFDTDDSSFGQTASGDIDNDGQDELVFGCYRNDSCIYALNAEDGSLLWKYNASGSGEGCNDVAPVIFDVDGDLQMEVVVPSSCNPKTFCFNGTTGAIEWQTPTRGSDSPPTIADIDNDGKPEILHGEFGGYVICINGEDGSIAWELLVDANSWVQTAPTIVDLDNDGQLDFVVATWNFSDDSKFYAYNGSTRALMWSKDMNDYVYHGTSVADLDNDNKPELVIGDYSGKLWVINGDDGTEYWTYDAPYYIGAPAVTGDVDGDGVCDVLFVSWFKVTALSNDGNLKWQYNIPDYGSPFRGVALSDMNNNGMPDAVFGCDDGKVYAVDGSTGILIWSMDLASHYGDTLEFDHAPVIGYFNEDDTLDLFIVGGQTDYPDFSGNYGRGYALSLGTTTAGTWPMFQYNIERNSSLCSYSGTPTEKYPMNPEISIFPVPATQNLQINIILNAPSCQKANVIIMTPEGKILVNENFEQSFVIQPGMLTSGIYFCTITRGMHSEVKKIIIL